MREKSLNLETAEAVHTHIHTGSFIGNDRKSKLKNSQSNPFVIGKASTSGITLVALVITVVVLLILAGITIMYVMGENSIFKLAKDAGEKTAEAVAREKVELMLKDYTPEKYIGTKTLEEYLNEQKGKGNLDEVTNNENGTITVEVDGYEITIKEDDLSIVSAEKAGGTRPIFEIKTTKTDGTALVGEETEKAITINITNIAELGENYTIEVKDEVGKAISKEANVASGVTGQASYIINKSGTYTITVTGTKEGITKATTKTENITVAKAQIEETEVVASLKSNGVIDIVWLDTENNVINEPISPANYLGGLTAIKYNGTSWVEADTTNTGNSWYNYVAQTGTTDGKTSNWANAVANFEGKDAEKAYFVWIPRYAYKITYFDTAENANKYRADSNGTAGIIGYSNREGIIAIKDGTEKLVKGSEPSNVTGIVKTEQYADYIPHPAFEFGGAKAGIWVGKFESSGSTSKVTIIPNTASLRSTTVSNIFTACQGVKTTYSLSGDSHMMKNTEWGVVVYLAESKYGRNGTEVGMNSANYTTGQGDYVTNANQSTTGNIYGVYDMNGTSWECVAGYINNSNVSSNGYNTNLINAVKTNPKYADVYPVTTDNQDTNYSNSKGIKGDAVFETSTAGSNSTSWHSAYTSFPNTSYQVFKRGRLLR